MLKEVSAVETSGSVLTAPALSTWTLDATHSSAGFSIKHLMVSNVRGEFRELSGTLQLDESNIENSSVNVTIKTASIHTRDEGRDTHLKSADFFDVEKNPEITFHSTEWSRKSDDELLVKGDLTMHGITKEVVLNVEGPTEQVKDPWGGTRIGFTASAKVNRDDFGLTWNAALEAGGVVVGKEVKIVIDAEFSKSA